MNFTYKIFIESDLKGFPKGFLKALNEAAKKTNVAKVAIVGGSVRDLINSKKINSLPINFRDIDIAIEGSAYDFSINLQNYLGKERLKIIRIYSEYKTVEIILDGFKIDIASTRKEFYHLPAYNPIVKEADLATDLQRRDFSVNAIAIEIIEKNILDLNRGVNDIKNSKLNFLHSKSVKDDPTRIIRAARYSARLNFKLSSQAISQIKAAIEKWPWGWRIGDSKNNVPPALGIRLRMELELLLNNEPWEKALVHLQTWGGLNLFDKKIQEDKKWFKTLSFAKELNLSLMTVFVCIAEDPEALAIRLQLPSKQQKIISESLKVKEFTKKTISHKGHKEWTPSTWTEKLEDLYVHPDALAIEICLRNPLKKQLLSWFKSWRFTKPPITGKDLIKKGMKPGPNIGQELRRQRKKLLDKNNNYI